MCSIQHTRLINMPTKAQLEAKIAYLDNKVLQERNEKARLKEELEQEKEKKVEQLQEELVEENEKLKTKVEDFEQEIKDKDDEIAELNNTAEEIVDAIYDRLFIRGWTNEQIRDLFGEAQKKCGFTLGGYINLPT